MSLAPTINRSEKCQLAIPNHGTLQGIKILEDDNDDIKCYRYTGIRFAQPPVGNLRWRKPQKLSKDFDYTGDYSSFKNVCPQPIFETVPDNPEIVYDEDCLFLNIWIPSGTPPEEGWPVLYFIHGGFLQVGSPHHFRQADPQDLLAKDSPAKYIIVAGGYRLNLFGYLSGKELIEEGGSDNCNFGFWDQRMGLEWVYDNIKHFGGNKDNITVGGLSAGSYSAIFQLAYELYHPEDRQIIKRVLLISNGLAIQPKTIPETQEQFDCLLEQFNLPLSVSSKEKLEKLRSIPYKDLVESIHHLKLHTFRAVTDDEFVPSSLFSDIYSGKFGQLMKQSGRSLMSGEVTNEWLLYASTNPPNTIDELAVQIENYYPKDVTKALVDFYPTPTNEEELREVFGNIVSDMQVHVSSRVLVNSLLKAGIDNDKVYRYRIGYRGDFFSKYAPIEAKVPHGGDLGIWFYTVFDGIREQEKPFYKNWLEPVAEYITTGKTDKWGTKSLTEYRVFNPDGSIEVKQDDQWDWATKVADVVAGIPSEARNNGSGQSPAAGGNVQ